MKSQNNASRETRTCLLILDEGHVLPPNAPRADHDDHEEALLEGCDAIREGDREEPR